MYGSIIKMDNTMTAIIVCNHSLFLLHNINESLIILPTQKNGTADSAESRYNGSWNFNSHNTTPIIPMIIEIIKYTNFDCTNFFIFMHIIFISNRHSRNHMALLNQTLWVRITPRSGALEKS